MKNSIEGIIYDIQHVGNIAENQAAATEEITAAIQEVSGNSQSLVEFAKIG
jgi:methyl-accepting chemotaxis protein